MYKNIYNRCKNYLNSYTTIGTVLVLLFFLLLPTFTYKESNNFFYNIIFAYQYNLVNVLAILYYVYNIWNYFHKNTNIVYQVHRYGSAKEVIKNNVCDAMFIGILLDIVFLILNISVAVLLNDGYYMSLYKCYEITNLVYYIYIIIVRFIFISIISILLYFIYYEDNKIVKFLLVFIIVFNLIDFGDMLPISMNTILSGYQFKTFSMEIISTIIMIFCYIIGLVILIKTTINKKRDIG